MLGDHDHDDGPRQVCTMIQGDVSEFLSALGAREGDALLQRALDFVGGEHEVDVFDDDDAVATYLVVPDRGVDFLLVDGVLSTVFIYATVNSEHAAYGAWPSLVHGVTASAGRDELVRALGEPKRSAAGYLLYETDQGFLQFDFDGETLTMAVVMTRDIGA